MELFLSIIFFLEVTAEIIFLFASLIVLLSSDSRYTYVTFSDECPIPVLMIETGIPFSLAVLAQVCLATYEVRCGVICIISDI